MPHFNFLCKKHSKDYCFYCFNCKSNLYDNCLSDDSHEIISFFKIGLTNVEANVIKVLINKIEENINNFNKMKNDIKILFNKMELINDNSSIYYDDSSNNYKEFYIEYLIAMNEKIKQLEKIKLLILKKKNQMKKKKKKKIKKKKKKKK